MFFPPPLIRDVREMLLKLVELRSSDWGRVRDAAAASNATPDNDPNYFMVSVFILSSSCQIVLFNEANYFNLICFHSIVHPQNEPTFYTEDGTPFTAADPGSGTRLFCTIRAGRNDYNFYTLIKLMLFPDTIYFTI